MKVLGIEIPEEFQDRFEGLSQEESESLLCAALDSYFESMNCENVRKQQTKP